MFGKNAIRPFLPLALYPTACVRPHHHVLNAIRLIMRRPGDRLVQPVLRSLAGSDWKRPPGQKQNLWTEVMKEDLSTLGLDRQFRRDVRCRRISNGEERIDSVQILAEDREGWAELCSKTAHLGEGAGNRVG
ncbi:hypothetical protein RB195_009039 [Necator americanus]|uniref:Uncharacterized protein n=1 Tax=Necator americanus TaxID=51031 RepID=A0ABR1CTD4_NECAM